MSTVIRPSFSCSSAPGEVIPVVLPNTGLLSSQVTELTGCGSVDWPWLISGGNGQRINVTLYDFSYEALTTRRPERDAIAISCNVYATIRDLSGGRSTTICGGRAPVRNVYYSTTNRVEIRILRFNAMSRQAQTSNFLLRYEGYKINLMSFFDMSFDIVSYL